MASTMAFSFVSLTVLATLVSDTVSWLAEKIKKQTPIVTRLPFVPRFLPGQSSLLAFALQTRKYHLLVLSGRALRRNSCSLVAKRFPTSALNTFQQNTHNAAGSFLFSFNALSAHYEHGALRGTSPNGFSCNALNLLSFYARSHNFFNLLSTNSQWFTLASRSAPYGFYANVLCDNAFGLVFTVPNNEFSDNAPRVALTVPVNAFSANVLPYNSSVLALTAPVSAFSLNVLTYNAAGLAFDAPVFALSKVLSYNAAVLALTALVSAFASNVLAYNAARLALTAPVYTLGNAAKLALTAPVYSVRHAPGLALTAPLYILCIAAIRKHSTGAVDFLFAGFCIFRATITFCAFGFSVSPDGSAIPTIPFTSASLDVSEMATTQFFCQMLQIICQLGKNMRVENSSLIQIGPNVFVAGVSISVLPTSSYEIAYNAPKMLNVACSGKSTFTCRPNEPCQHFLFQNDISLSAPFIFCSLIQLFGPFGGHTGAQLAAPIAVSCDEPHAWPHRTVRCRRDGVRWSYFRFKSSKAYCFEIESKIPPLTPTSSCYFKSSLLCSQKP